MEVDMEYDLNIKVEESCKKKVRQKINKDFKDATRFKALNTVKSLRKQGKCWEWIWIAFQCKFADWENKGFGLMYYPNFTNRVDEILENNYINRNWSDKTIEELDKELFED